MKYFIIIPMLFLFFNSFGQNNAKTSKTDTLNIFQRTDNELFKENNSYWHYENQVGIKQVQYHQGGWDNGKAIVLEILFKNWSKIVLDKEYQVETYEDIILECKSSRVWGTVTLPNSKGYIRLIDKTANTLTFVFNITVSEIDNKHILIYNGERKFIKDF